MSLILFVTYNTFVYFNQIFTIIINLNSYLLKRLEEDLKKLRLEIQQQKSVEQYLRNQINYITKCDRTEKLKLERLQQENKTLQTK